MARTKDFDETEVLNRAMNIFWSRGYNATSMEDLVSGLGISRSSLYDTYVDKHTLFIKALKNYNQLNHLKIQEIINRNGPAKETMRILIEMVTTGISSGKKQTGCLMVNAEVEVAPFDKEVNKLVCRNYEELEELFYQVIEKGKKKGEIKTRQDTKSLARFILNAVKGMQVTAKTISDNFVFDDIIKLTLTVLD